MSVAAAHGGRSLASPMRRVACRRIGWNSARLRSAGVQTYGLLPFPLAAEDELRMHGDNEHITLDELDELTELYTVALARLAQGS